MALVKYNNNSISSVTATAGLASGGLNLITTNTISSGVSSCSFTSNINSTYDTYLFKFINIHPATNAAVLQVNFRDGSSAFDATKTTTHFFALHYESDSSTAFNYDTGQDIAQGTGYQPITNAVGNGNDESASGELYLFSPSSTTFVKHFIARSLIYHEGDSAIDSYTGGYCNVTAAIDGVDFKFSSGNIDSGVIKMYGLSKS